MKNNNPFDSILLAYIESLPDEFDQIPEKRISLPYNDPKEFDGTSLETKKYEDCCREIAREMFFAMDYGYLEKLLFSNAIV